jgi:hypothetical protein
MDTPDFMKKILNTPFKFWCCSNSAHKQVRWNLEGNQAACEHCDELSPVSEDSGAGVILRTIGVVVDVSFPYPHRPKPYDLLQIIGFNDTELEVQQILSGQIVRTIAIGKVTKGWRDGLAVINLSTK